MSTCQSIIRRALRFMGVLAAGQQPTGSDSADAMESFQALLLAIPGLIQNGRWREHATTTAYIAREGYRISVTAPGSVTLPTTITWETGARAPRDLAKVQILGAADNVGLWLYSATKATWGKVDGLALADEAPFGSEDDEGLAAQLAVNMGDDYGATATIGARTLAIAQQSARSLRARLKKAEPTDWSRPGLSRPVCRDYC